MRPKLLIWLNTLTLLVTLFMNYLGSTGRLTGRDVGDISEQYPTLITPADYAFSIWGVIYLMLILFVGFQWYLVYRENRSEEVEATGWWLAAANLANAGWIIVWVSELPGLSVILMLVLLFSLIRLVVRLRLELWDAPLRIIFFVWWPITIYFGWIIVATVTNVAAWLVSLGYRGAPFNETVWTIIMLAVATGLYLQLTFSRNLREAAAVGMWAFISIAIKHWGEVPSVASAALVATVVLLLATGYHGFQNRDTGPGVKAMRGEWR